MSTFLLVGPANYLNLDNVRRIEPHGTDTLITDTAGKVTRLAVPASLLGRTLLQAPGVRVIDLYSVVGLHEQAQARCAHTNGEDAAHVESNDA